MGHKFTQIHALLAYFRILYTSFYTMYRILFLNHNQRGMKFLLLICLLVLIACNDGQEPTARTDGYTPVLKTREDSLYHEVMEGHDVGMAKMGQLRDRQKRIQRSLDSIKKLSAQKVNPVLKQALLTVQEELSYADTAMFKWMEEFNVDSARDDKTTRIAYLESEKMKVVKVRDNILNSLKRADSLLNK